jgi:glycosyltransferase involved in cell wall biosynthesis
LKILIVSNDFNPPWNNGIKVYARGLENSIHCLSGSDVLVTESLSKIDSDSYDFVHIVQTGLKPLTNVLQKFRSKTIFKHIITPSTGFANALNTKVFYSIVNGLAARLVNCYSSELVARSYFMQGNTVIPPSIDTSTFRDIHTVDEEEVISIVKKGDRVTWSENLRRHSGGIILYSGPLTEDRFPHLSVLNAIRNLDVQLLIVARDGNSNRKMEEIIKYAKKLRIEEKITMALKVLTEQEKIALINYCDVIIQPFSGNIKYVAVDPPIFLLESMACGKPVITSRTYSMDLVIKNGYNGFAVDWSQPNEFAEALDKCLTNKLVMGINARQTVLNEFSAEKISQRLKTLYDFYRSQ